MNGTALYRALVEAGTSEERAKEAAETVLYAKEGATRADIVGVQAEVGGVRAEVADVKAQVAVVQAEVADLQTEVADVKAKVEGVQADVVEVKLDLMKIKMEFSNRIAALEATMERSFRAMTFRLIGAMFAMQALMLAALKLTA